MLFLSMYLALLLKMDAADEDSHSQDVFAGLSIAAHGVMIFIVMTNALLVHCERISGRQGLRDVRVDSGSF